MPRVLSVKITKNHLRILRWVEARKAVAAYHCVAPARRPYGYDLPHEMGAPDGDLRPHMLEPRRYTRREFAELTNAGYLKADVAHLQCIWTVTDKGHALLDERGRPL